MRRMLSLLICSLFALACVMPPTPALASEDEAVSATFEDANLYAALADQLTNQGVAFIGNPEANTINIRAAEAAKIRELNLSYASISNLAGIDALAALPNLTRLDLSHNALANNAGSPLAALHGLTYLDLYENSIADWTFLGFLTNLEHLNLGLNKRGGDTREALRQLKNLKWLDFSFAGPKSEDVTEKNPNKSFNYIISILSDLNNLEHVDLCAWYINSLKGMGNLTKLKTLILNENYVRDLTPLVACTELEELHVARNRMYWGKNDKGIGGILNADGSLKLPKLRRLDMWGQEENNGKNRLSDPTATEVRSQINALYRLHAAGKLELGYDYRWIDDLKDLQPHEDSSGTYIAYEDFGTYCREGSDDWDAMRNAHQYANDHGCEVRAVVGSGPTAAQDKIYHVYRHYDREDYYAYTSVDWQGATFVIHHEDVDWHYPCGHQPLPYLRPSPAGFASTGMRAADNTLTFDASATDEAKRLTIHEDRLPLARDVTSIKGLSDQIDGTLAELGQKGYNRFYVQLFDANVRRYRRGYTYRYTGDPQWDALVVDGNGTVQRLNAAKLAGTETPAGALIPSDPDPLQWQFDHITKVVIAPIANNQSHIRNARFVVMPLDSKVELPRERWGSVYRDNLEISGTNFELANIVQTVGTAETGWDHNELSGNYVGFLDLKDCAEVDMHDCYTWQRVCTRSTYGFQTLRIVCAHIKNVGDSNPGHPDNYRGGHGNHGGNYGKHLLWEDITLGRIDQHTGCYDLAVRRGNVRSLSLTGAGPLTVEDTKVTGRYFLNLRSDYGSTWDGVANIINCTHVLKLDETGEPDGFASCRAEPNWDLGYPQRYPETHVKNFTIDCSNYPRQKNSRYRMTYGIVCNYNNGLNRLDDEALNDLKGYWPDTIEMDGLNIVNWRETIGYEPHTIMPLYMLGKPAARAKAGSYTLKNITYDGEPFVPATFEGTDEFVDLTTNNMIWKAVKDVREVKDIDKTASFTNDQMELLKTHDVVVAYEGDEPRVLFRVSGVSGNESWITAYPYLVEHRGETNVGYYSGREYLYLWHKVQEEHPNAGNFSKLLISAESFASDDGETHDGTAEILHVRLMETRGGHVHAWGEPTYEWSDDYATCMAKRVCTEDASHVESEVATSTSVVTREPTGTEKGLTTYTAEFRNACFETQVREVETPVRLALQIEYEGYEGVYDGKPHAPKASAREGAADKVAFAYSTDGGKTWSEEAPSITGVGELAVMVRGTCVGFEDSTAEATLRVLPRVAELQWESVELTYTGAPQVPLVSLANLAEGDVVGVEVDGAQTAVGPLDATSPYRASVTRLTGAAAKNYALPENSSVTFSIAKAPIEPKVAISDCDWGVSVTPVVTGNPGTGDVSLEYRPTGAGEDAWSADTPTLPGTYEVRATIAESASYLGGQASATFSIGRIPLVVTAEDKSGPYGSEPAELTHTIDGTVLPGDEVGVALSCAVTSASGPGTYPITPTCTADPTRYSVALVPGTYTVEAGSSDVVAEGWEGTYDGRAHGIDIKTADSDAVVWYSDASVLTADNYATEGTQASPTRTDVGVTDVHYYVRRSDGTGVAGTTRIAVRPAPLEMRAPDASVAYGDSLPEGLAVTYIGFVAGEDAKVLSGELAWDANGYAAGCDAGVYALVPTGLSGKNYEVRPVAGTLTVVPRVAEVAWQVSAGLVYTGAEQGIRAEVGNRYGSDDVAVVLEESCATDAGAYVARAARLAGAKAKNYVLPEESEANAHAWSIAKAPLDIVVSIEGWQEGSRDPSRNAPRVEGNAGGGSVTFAYRGANQPDSAYADEAPTKAGSYVVQATVAETANYVGGVATAGFVVAPAAPPAAGTTQDVTDPQGNWGSARIATDADSLRAAVPLTDHERAAVSEGQDVQVWLETSAKEDAIPLVERDALNEKCSATGWKMGSCFVANLFKRVGDEVTQLRELAEPVRLVIELPDGLLRAPEGWTRTFCVLRVHEGTVDFLEADAELSLGTLAFSTDRFSTYAVVYRDVADQGVTSAHAAATATSPVRPRPASGSTSTDRLASTGDRHVGGLALVLSLAAACIFVGIVRQ